MAVFHSAQTAADGIHIVTRWEVANAAARTALVLTSVDIGGIARQADTGLFYVLNNNVGPVWQPIEVTFANVNAALAAANAAININAQTLTNVGTLSVGTSTNKTTVSATGDLKLPTSATNGVTIHNQVDEATNFERLRIAAVANVWSLLSEAGGTGTQRGIVIQNTAGQGLSIASGGVNTLTALNVTAATSNRLTSSGSMQSSTLLQAVCTIDGTYFQSGTAGADVLYVNPTLTAVGSAGANLIKLSVAGVVKARVDSNGKITQDTTTTAAGTTGAQTINKPTGTVNIAAAGTSVVVTNSLVTATSLVFPVLRTADATARIAHCVPAAGSFTITLTAGAAAEVSIGFQVIN